MKTYYNFDEWETAARAIGYVRHETDDWSVVYHEGTDALVGEYIQDRGYLYTGDDYEIFHK